MKLFSSVFTLMFFTTSTLFAQSEIKETFPIDDDSGHVKFQEVVNMAGVNQAELFKRANTWFKDFYKNPGSVIQTKNADKGLIIGKKKFDLFREIDGKRTHVGFVNYEITIGAKEGRYRYTVNELYFIDSPRNYIENWYEGTPEEMVWQTKYLEQVKEYVDTLVASVKEGMAKAEVVETDDW